MHYVYHFKKFNDTQRRSRSFVKLIGLHIYVHIFSSIYFTKMKNENKRLIRGKPDCNISKNHLIIWKIGDEKKEQEIGSLGIFYLS